MTDVREPLDGAHLGEATGSVEPGSPEGAGRSHLARNAALVVGAVVLLLIGVLATREPPGETANSLVGHRVPVLAGPTLDGGTFDIDKVQNRIDPSQGKWVLVNFLASWCVGCQVEHPDLIAFAERHPDDVQIVGVAYDDSPEKLREFFRMRGGDWPVVLPERKQVAVDFGVTVVPESFLIRPDGVVVDWATGVTLDWLERKLVEHGGGSPAGPSTTVAGAPR